MLHVFIINSFAGKGGFSDEIRNSIESRTDIEYLIFNSEYPGHEAELAGQIYDLFSDETIRFYACGGSGTFRNIMKGLPDFDRAQFVEVPLGTTNDFLAVFGKQRHFFNNLDSLINGKVLEIDYIKSNLGPAHNTLSSGYDVKLLKISEKLKYLPFPLGGVLYFVSGIAALFVKSSIKAEFVIDDGERFMTTAEQFTMANGNLLGGTFHMAENNDPTDGKLLLKIFSGSNKFLKVRAFMSLIIKKSTKPKNCMVSDCKKIRVVPEKGNEFFGNFDGEIEHGEYLEAEIIPKGLKYIIPKEIEL